MITTEAWADVPGFSGRYRVSNLGRVKSFVVHQGGKDMNGHLDELRYVCHQLLRADGSVLRVRAHQMVLAAFVGPQGKGVEVRHLDGDPSNNRLDNLAYGSRSENVRDAIRHGRWNEGEKSKKHILSDSQAVEIRESRESTQQIAARLGVRYAVVYRVRAGLSWKHAVQTNRAA